MMDPEIGQFIVKIEESIRNLSERMNHITLLQGQLAIMERQLDSITALVSRSYVGTIDPAARQVALEEAKKLADEAAKVKEAEIEALIQARGGDHPPTEEELAQAANEFQ